MLRLYGPDTRGQRMDTEYPNTKHTLSSNAFSTDQQACDVVAWLRLNHPEQYVEIAKKFHVLFIPSNASHFEEEQFEYGWNPDYGSWLVDAIEETGLVLWIDGEPFALENDESE